MAYIYQITNDINNKIYIGKTEFSVEKRFKEHCSDALRNQNEHRPLYSAMKKYGIEHFHIEIIEETDNPEEREIYWIKEKDSYHNGYNATMGGDGKKYIDYDLVVENYLKTKRASETAKLLNIDINSVYYILKNKGIEKDDISNIVKKEIREKSGKHCKQYDLNGNLLNTFDTLNDAGRYISSLQITPSNFDKIASRIGQVCSNKRKTAYGYIWKFFE